MEVEEYSVEKVTEALDDGLKKDWRIKIDHKPSHDEILEAVYKKIGSDHGELIEAKSGDSIEERKTENGLQLHRVWRFATSPSWWIVIVRSKWSRTMWTEKKDNVEILHFEWSSPGKPDDQDLRAILDKEMGTEMGGRQGREVIIKGHGAREHKSQDGKYFEREWNMDVQKEFFGQGSGEFQWEVVTKKTEWHPVSEDFEVVHEVTPAERCPWLEGPHKDGAKEPLCSEGVFSWECKAGRHGSRVQCPKEWPFMCEDSTCAGGKDHCCEKKESDCKLGPRKCHTEKPTTTTTTTVFADCGRLEGESFQDETAAGVKCEGGLMVSLGRANGDQCERKCERQKKTGCCAHSAMFDVCTFIEDGKATGAGAPFDKAIMCKA